MLRSVGYGQDYTTFVKISDRFEDYKFFNPKLPQKYFGNIPIRPSVIADGFKNDKDDYTFRIFALGGSSTAGYPHTGNGSFVRLLKNRLQMEYPQVNFEVINLGVSAINSITIRDIIDDVLIEKPDLIIIYAGHNEYYGALGPASKVSAISNLFSTRLILGLKEFRTVQLLENLMGSVVSAFVEKSDGSKTLMSEMAGKNLVEFRSEKYFEGLNQFESNLEYVISRCQEEEVTAILGTLTSNLMQFPLCRFVGCSSLFEDFELVVNNSNNLNREKLYEIKDKDELRFRAPEEFNSVIDILGKKYESKVLDIQEIFEVNSPNGIVGDNLMLDHLHPTFTGNKLIANLYFDSILSNKEIHSKLTKIRSPKFLLNATLFRTFTELDSLFAHFRIKYLKNDFPFVKEKKQLNIVPNSLTIEEKYAQEIIEGKSSWESAHLKLAEHFLKSGNLRGYLEEINVLIEDKPFDKYSYLEAIKTLEKRKQNEYLKYFLHKYHNYFPDLFSASKLGHLYFNEKNHKRAIIFYEKCISASDDPKIFFNLSASYFEVKQLTKAIENIQKCLSLDPNYPNANKIYNGLLKIYSSKK